MSQNANQDAIDLMKTDSENIRHIAQFGSSIEKAMARVLLRIVSEQ
jgi:hypothetical protein